MKKIFIIVAVIFMFASATAFAAEAPVPIKFEKAGGGQFLYCNNPEYVTESDLSTDENPKPVYMMKQENLKPGKYSVFFCFYNWTNFAVEPDIEFVSNNAKITINSVGYALPQGEEFWDCLRAWSDYKGMNIRTIDGLAQHTPYQKIDLPKTFSLKNSTEWISPYIYNYNSVSPKLTFNMLVDFTIESGTADVNFAALKSYDVIGDRSHHAKNALQSPYKNDTSIKGIERDTLPMVEAKLDVNITSKTKNVPVKVYNQYFPGGKICDYWMTNINPSRDAYEYSKECSAGSDMLEFEFLDNSKFSYYGNGVANKDNVWHFDIYHHNTTEYVDGCPSKSKRLHIPNDKLPERLDINNPPNLEYEFNLGNFGVTNRYYLNVKNSTTISRSINYYIDASLSSCIVAVRDKEGNLLNPYTLQTEDAYALSKGIRGSKVRDYMFSAMLKPGEERDFIIDVTLPTNCYGGIVNGLMADTVLKCEPQEITEFAQNSELYPYAINTWFDGNKLMQWVDGELNVYDKKWIKKTLPDKTREAFEGRTKDLRLTKTAYGYVARFCGYDGFGDKISEPDKENKLYVLDEKLNYEKTLEFPQYITSAVYADGITYIKSDKIYESKNGLAFTESDMQEMPVSDGKSVIEKHDDGYYVRYNGEEEFEKINFEFTPSDRILASDGAYYMIRSLKNYDTDFETANIIGVSTDGVNFRDMNLPNRQLKFKNLDSVGSDLFAVGQNEVVQRDRFDFSNGVRIKTPEGYLSLSYTLENFDGKICMDIKYLANVFDMEVNTYEGEDEKLRIEVKKGDNTAWILTDSGAIYSGSNSRFVGVAPHTSWGTVYVPFKDFMEIFGYNVEYDETELTVNVTD